jgi:hypothetical protein
VQQLWCGSGTGQRRRPLGNFHPPRAKETVAKVEVQGENQLKHLFCHFTPVVVFHESIYNDSEVKHSNFLPFGTAPTDSLVNQK